MAEEDDVVIVIGDEPEAEPEPDHGMDLAMRFPRGSFATAIWEKVKVETDQPFDMARLNLVAMFFGLTQEQADARAKEWVDSRVVPHAFQVGPVKMKPADA